MARYSIWLAANALALAISSGAFAANETVIYAFQGGVDGETPANGVIADKAGNLYGTTQYGGTGNCSLPNATGCGTIFRLTPPADPSGSWIKSVLYSFQGGIDGQFPGGLLLDGGGNLYGTSATGGPFTCYALYNCGTVFKLVRPASTAGAWTKTVIYNFRGGTDGFGPGGSLVTDSAGNLYGTTFDGGPAACPDCGTVFELSPDPASTTWRKTTLYIFQPFPRRGSLGDAQGPINVAFDGVGNLIGAAANGGYCQRWEGGGCFGGLFQLTRPSTAGGAWTETVTYRFPPIVGAPVSAVLVAEDGTVFGATATEVFEEADGKSDSLLTFGPPNELGGYPWAGVIFGPDNTLFAVAQGGTGVEPGTCCGAVFALTRPDKSGVGWTLTPLHNFGGSAVGDGELPNPKLLLGPGGALYGTTWRGGTEGCQYYGNIGCGTVFRIVP